METLRFGFWKTRLLLLISLQFWQFRSYFSLSFVLFPSSFFSHFWLLCGSRKESLCGCLVTQHGGHWFSPSLLPWIGSEPTAVRNLHKDFCFFFLADEIDRGTGTGRELVCFIWWNPIRVSQILEMRLSEPDRMSPYDCWYVVQDFFFLANSQKRKCLT